MNPFEIEVLDCRQLALRFQSFTTLPAVALTFNRLRASDGRHLIGQRPDDVVISETTLRYPFHGQPDPGPICRAREMEDRWDIYAYGNEVYLTDSWTGVLIHVLECEFTAATVHVRRIFSNRKAVRGELGFAPAEVNFLLLTHLAKTLLPFPIPATSPRVSKELASAGISSYGRWAQFGTYEWKQSMG